MDCKECKPILDVNEALNYQGKLTDLWKAEQQRADKLQVRVDKLIDENIRLRNMLQQYAYWIKTEYKLATDVLEKIESIMKTCPYFEVKDGAYRQEQICHCYNKNKCDCRGVMEMCSFPEI